MQGVQRYIKGMLWTLIVAALISGPARAQEFLVGLEDVPVMDGLEVAEDSSMVFDSPTGRIVEVYATGNTGRAAVTDFYSRTLPALGWTREGDRRYAREGEALAMDFFGPEGELTIRFTLAPQ